jgi:DNA-binding transcriptional ArsR family regulator
MVVDANLQGMNDRLFQALADPTRRDIVRRTMQQEHSVSALARLYPMSFAAVQKHVAVLERADLVTKQRHGREQLVRGNVAAVRRASELLAQYEALWRHRVGQMDRILDHDNTTGAKP